MRHRIQTGLSLLVSAGTLAGCVILVSGCDGRASIPGSTAPTPTPTPTPSPAPAVTYILSGVVFEVTDAGEVPIEGVELYCDSCGSPEGHTFVNTDADGFYSLAYAHDGSHPLFVTKAGYQIFDPTDQLGRITATVRGDTRFNIRLTRR
jgi:hypothetical protein